MPDDRKPSPLELGLYARAEAEPRITLIEILAGVLTLSGSWPFSFFGFGGSEDGASGGAGGLARSVLAVLAVLLPVALIWVVAVARDPRARSGRRPTGCRPPSMPCGSPMWSNSKTRRSALSRSYCAASRN
jgi:hypothetical protein